MIFRAFKKVKKDSRREQTLTIANLNSTQVAY